jgi:hypothetical protein
MDATLVRVIDGGLDGIDPRILDSAACGADRIVGASAECAIWSAAVLDRFRNVQTLELLCHGSPVVLMLGSESMLVQVQRA